MSILFRRREFMMALGSSLIGAGCGERLAPQPPKSKQSTEVLRRQPAAQQTKNPHIDGEWFRHSLVEDNLRYWLAAAPTPNGFFQSNLDRQWRPAKDQAATLVSQSRLLFVFATGYEITKDQAYLDAVQSGGGFLLKYFQDPTYGGLFWSVSADGQMLGDGGKGSYGHAFAIFGLSHAYRVSRDDRFLAAALETWQTLKSKMFDVHGGLMQYATVDFTPTNGGNSMNPIMHLFEALLALHDVTDSSAIFEDARKLVEFVITRLYRDAEGYIPEEFGPEWQALPNPPGEWCRMGHQPEWSFLLSRAAEKGFSERLVTIGNRLLDYCMKNGYDPKEGGLTEGPLGQGKSRWPQCEFLRALMRYASQHSRDDLWLPFDRTLALVKRDFLDAEFGGWFDNPTTRDKGNVWNVGYHQTGMYLEAMRIGGTGPI